MNQTTYASRLNQAMEAAGMTQAALAEMVGLAQASIWKLTSGASKGSRKTVEIARALGVSPEWLSFGSGPMFLSDSPHTTARTEPPITRLDGGYRVEVLDVQASAGKGTLLTSDFVETIRAIEYTEEKARALFGGRPAHTVKVITVRGDSMEGTISPGDEIFVDISVNNFDGDGIYVFVFGKNLHVKRLQMQRNRLAVMSDNPLYEKWYMEDGDEDQFYIMAKVLLRQSMDIKRFA
ncbi:helix-turn-helix transcriptional regulator [Serratia quinivorans]|uniref:XRE family transcriptional regulator n=1 Tax=Serratia quinivorans TaxID=137545 RepID=UPI002E76A99D|nr:helix-turn-helix transcriptional regulator [Serratia quinivorans]